MAISTTSFGSVSKPRIFIDNIQYAKMLNPVLQFSSPNSSGNIVTNSNIEDNLTRQNELWDMNPVNTLNINQDPYATSNQDIVRFKKSKIMVSKIVRRMEK